MLITLLITRGLSTKIGVKGMYVIKKSTLVIWTALILTAITFIICISSISGESINKSSAKSYTIVLDAGHGGIDNGVSGIKTGVTESELNLKIVNKIESYLLSGGFNVVLTRSSSQGLYGVATSNRKKKDMQKRKEIIESAKPSLVVSVHLNKYSVSSRRGAQVFYKKGDELSKSLAENIQSGFNELNQDIKAYSALTGDYYILNCTDYPAVIAECGFLSNPEDEELLLTDEYQEKIAYTIYQGIISYFSVNSFKFCD